MCLHLFQTAGPHAYLQARIFPVHTNSNTPICTCDLYHIPFGLLPVLHQFSFFSQEEADKLTNITTFFFSEYCAYVPEWHHILYSRWLDIDIYLTNERHRYMLTLKKIPIAKNKFHSKFIDLKINWMKTKTTKVNGSIRGLWWFRQNIPPPFGSLRFTGLTEPHLCN